jgi:hypothetical protein
MSVFAAAGHGADAPSLADYIDLLLPAEPDALISATAQARLRAQADRLPAIPRIAVECRLAEGADQVDLQLCLRRDAGDYDHFADYVVARSGSGHGATGADASLGLARFAARLCEPDSALRRAVVELYLECDLGADVDVGRTPAVFLSLPYDQDEALRTASEALHLLRPDPPPALLKSIERCFAACAGDAGISHLGVMLSRPVDPVRLNVKGLLPCEAEGFLAACGWPGDRARAAALFDAAADRADRVTLALDVGETLLPRIGVECFHDMQPGANPAWRARLAELCAEGLASMAKVDAFLRVPATDGPSRERPWPADLMLDSLLRSDDELTAIARRLVHLKITETAGVRREAKAYFGAGVITYTPTRPRGAQPWRPELAALRPRPSLAAWATPPEGPLERSLSLGIRWLIGAQLQSGLWRDFHVPTGVSDEWVSGFVGAQLASTGDACARAAASASLERLRRRQRRHGGWGYNGDHPCDADSTAWALRLATGLVDPDEPMADRGRRFIAAHLRDDGALATFIDREGVVAVTGLPEDASLAGWLFVHDCVTAAAAAFLPERSTDYLRGRQGDDGAWTGYWWEHSAYPTWMSTEALRARPAPGDGMRLQAAETCARGWIETALGAPERSSAFDVACALRVLLAGPRRTHREWIDAGAAWLTERQDADGGWPPGARLRIPAWRQVTPGVGDMICLDRRGAFSSAAAVGALSAVLAAANSA